MVKPWLKKHCQVFFLLFCCFLRSCREVLLPSALPAARPAARSHWRGAHAVRAGGIGRQLRRSPQWLPVGISLIIWMIFTHQQPFWVGKLEYPTGLKLKKTSQSAHAPATRMRFLDDERINLVWPGEIFLVWCIFSCRKVSLVAEVAMSFPSATWLPCLQDLCHLWRYLHFPQKMSFFFETNIMLMFNYFSKLRKPYLSK